MSIYKNHESSTSGESQKGRATSHRNSFSSECFGYSDIDASSSTGYAHHIYSQTSQATIIEKALKWAKKLQVTRDLTFEPGVPNRISTDVESEMAGNPAAFISALNIIVESVNSRATDDTIVSLLGALATSRFQEKSELARAILRYQQTKRPQVMDAIAMAFSRDGLADPSYVAELELLRDQTPFSGVKVEFDRTIQELKEIGSHVNDGARTAVP